MDILNFDFSHDHADLKGDYSSLIFLVPKTNSRTCSLKTYQLNNFSYFQLCKIFEQNQSSRLPDLVNIDLFIDSNIHILFTGRYCDSINSAILTHYHRFSFIFAHKDDQLVFYSHKNPSLISDETHLN